MTHGDAKHTSWRIRTKPIWRHQLLICTMKHTQQFLAQCVSEILCTGTFLLSINDSFSSSMWFRDICHRRHARYNPFELTCFKETCHYSSHLFRSPEVILPARKVRVPDCFTCQYARLTLKSNFSNMDQFSRNLTFSWRFKATLAATAVPVVRRWSLRSAVCDVYIQFAFREKIFHWAH